MKPDIFARVGNTMLLSHIANSILQHKIRDILVFLLLVWSTENAYSNKIYEGHFTGAELYEIVPLTQRTLALDGDVLLVSSTDPVNTHDRLLSIPIVPAGTVQEFEAVLFSFTLTENPPPGASGDHDIYVALEDGLGRFVGFGRQDNSGWRGTSLVPDGSSWTAHEFGSVGFSATFSGYVTVSSGADTIVAGEINNASMSTTYTDLVLHPENGLSFFIQLDHYFESYAISSISVRVETALPGDYNADDAVTAADYIVWRKRSGTIGLQPFESGDGNGDGKVNDADYASWKRRFGVVLNEALNPASVSDNFRVPEPKMLTYLCLLGITHLRRRGRMAISSSVFS